MSPESSPFIALIVASVVIGGTSAITILHARTVFQRVTLFGVLGASLCLLAATTVGMAVPDRTIYHNTIRVPGFVWIGSLVLWAMSTALPSASSPQSKRGLRRNCP